MLGVGFARAGSPKAGAEDGEGGTDPASTEAKKEFR
jgi:hypothetical protein